MFAAGITFTGDDNGTGEVKAYLNYLLFDDDYMLRDAGFTSLSPGALEDGTNVLHERLALEVVPEQDGFIYIYTSNESPQVTNVYFDDFSVTHEKLVPDEGYNPDLVAYRYGFNGKEKDQSGEFGMNHYDYGFRIYNPALGRFLSVDPLTASYPWYTPYQFAANTPIQAVDLDGLEEYKIHSKWLSDLFYSTKRRMDSYKISYETKKAILTAMLKRWENRKPEDPEALRQYGYVDKLVTISDPNAAFSVKGPLTGSQNLLLVDEELQLRVVATARKIEESKARTINHLRRMHQILVEQDKVDRQAKITLAVATIVASGGSLAFTVGAGAGAGAITLSLIADGSTIVFSADDIIKINSFDGKGFLQSRGLTEEQINAARFIGSALDLRTKKDLLKEGFKFHKTLKELQQATEALDAIIDVQTVTQTGEKLLKKQ